MSAKTLVKGTIKTFGIIITIIINVFPYKCVIAAEIFTFLFPEHADHIPDNRSYNDILVSVFFSTFVTFSM